MKTKIYAFLFSIFTAFLRLTRKPEPGSALVMPPYSPGSFGDEAVVTSVVVQLARQGVKKIGLISYRDDDDWSYLSGIAEVFSLQDYFEYESWGVRFRFCRMASRYERFIVLGTDVMDGYYGGRDSQQRIAVTEMAARAGVPTRIISFSFNSRPNPECVQLLKQLPQPVRMFGRDPLSRQRLADFLQRPVELVADVAFMLEPSPETDKVQSVYRWVEAERHFTIYGVRFYAKNIHTLIRFIPNASKIPNALWIGNEHCVQMSTNHPFFYNLKTCCIYR